MAKQNRRLRQKQTHKAEQRSTLDPRRQVDSEVGSSLCHSATLTLCRPTVSPNQED